jgi:hypothetical protein
MLSCNPVAAGGAHLDREDGAADNGSIVTVAAPPRPPRPEDPQALFEEARLHRRRRRLQLVGLALTVLIAAGGAYAIFGYGANDDATGGGLRPAAATPDTTVVLLVDVSGSMRAEDVGAQRLEAAVSAMRGFLDPLPKRFPVGVVAFSSTAKVVLPPTRDRAAVVAALGTLQPEAGTALGAGLTAAVELAAKAQGPAAIVLESDGAQNRGTVTPSQAAATARKAGIRVYGIALGTSKGVVHFGFGVRGSDIPVPPDPQVVRLMARLTGGKAFTATSAARLDAIYRELGSTIGR